MIETLTKQGENGMKKLISSILILCMMLTLAACSVIINGENYKDDTLAEYLDRNGISRDDLDAAVAAAAMTPPALPAPTPVSTSVPTPAPTPEVTATPVPTAVPTPTPAQTTPAPVKYLTITKNPTSEYIKEGGNAVFIAYAENYRYLGWSLISPDGTPYNITSAPAMFPGLYIGGEDTCQLVLYNCPLSINGWRVDCSFMADGTSRSTSRAYIYVEKEKGLYASPSNGYFQYCDESVYLFAGRNDKICYALYRSCDGGGRVLYSDGTVSSGDAVYLGWDNGVCWTYYLYAYVKGDPENSISCRYTVDGIDYESGEGGFIIGPG